MTWSRGGGLMIALVVWPACVGNTPDEPCAAPCGEDAAVAIRAFAARPSSVARGSVSTLSWSSENATRCSLSPGVGTVPRSGSLAVRPEESADYRLACEGNGGPASADLTVTVVPLPAADAGVPADGGGGEDGGTDAGQPPDPVLSIVDKRIAAAGDFSTLQAWADARAGSLSTRRVYAITDIEGALQPGELLQGASCEGRYVAEGALAGSTRLTLDDANGDCALGDTLTAQSTGLAVVVGALRRGPGVIERGLVAETGVRDETVVLAAPVGGTSAEHYLWLSVEPAHRHHGRAGAGAVLLPSAPAHVVTIEAAYTRVSWLEITGWKNVVDDNSYEGVSVRADGVVLEHLLIHDNDDSAMTNTNADGINVDAMPAGGSVHIRGCVLYNLSRSGILRSPGAEDVGGDVFIESTTVYNTGTDLCPADGRSGIANTDGLTTLHVRNTLSIGSCLGREDRCEGCEFSSTAPDFYSAGPVADAVGNGSADGTAPGDDARHALDAEALFESIVPGDEDLHLAAGSPAIDTGVASELLVDIDGEARPLGLGWDMGADERAP